MAFGLELRCQLFPGSLAGQATRRIWGAPASVTLYANSLKSFSFSLPLFLFLIVVITFQFQYIELANHRVLHGKLIQSALSVPVGSAAESSARAWIPGAWRVESVGAEPAGLGG